MKIYSVADLRNQFKELGYEWLNFNIIGIRSKADVPNKFDDSFILIENNLITVYTSCTTNPGTYWLQNPENINGTAVMKPGQNIDCWAIGKHKNQYTALVQCRDITVWRDNDKDLKSESGKEFKGIFGINIHHASSKHDSINVDKWSAGCQVLNVCNDYDLFIARCLKSKLKYFSYTLLNEF